MPNIRTPKAMPRGGAPVATPPAAKKAANRVSRVLNTVGTAALRFCLVVERLKRSGVAATEIEAELGLDADDLEAHYEACHLVATNAGLTPPAWS